MAHAELRIRLESRLSFQLLREHRIAEATALCRESLLAARSLGDASVLAEVLADSHAELVATGRGDEIVPAAEEGLRAARSIAARPLVYRFQLHLLDAALFDGDADRCAFVDDQGRTVGADLITTILARRMLAQHPGKGIIYDLRSSRVVPETVERLGGRPVRERVGHSFMKDTMRKQDCIGGGELSGHFYFSLFHNSDCGLLAALMTLAQLGDEGKSLQQAADELRIYYQSGEINFRVEDKDAAIAKLKREFADGRQDELDGITVEFGDLGDDAWWWFNVRASNTEPLLRLNLEASERDLRDERRDQLVALLGEPEA